jgi:tRNA-(ms[2]io[6]A)-hydroxylase
MLGLKAETDAAWVDHAIGDLDRVLVDHAHCEMKAASNALSLAARHPDTPEVVRALAAIAREEIEHFERVLEVLAARGLALGPPPVDEYAAALRRGAAADRRGPDVGPLADRLLVGALIEARSCERFKLLAARLERHEGARERGLGTFYAELLAAEARHYRTMVDLAALAAERATGAGRAAVLARLDVLAEREAAIVRGLVQPARARATIHG